MTEPLYVIPDIHGQRLMLEDALARIAEDGGASASVVFLGDLVDRGPDSRGVIQTIIEGLACGRDWTVLRGNHDQIFLDFLARAEADETYPRPGDRWLSDNIGGMNTLASYGITHHDLRQKGAGVISAIPRSHRDFLSGLPFCRETDHLFLVHAGIRPGVPLAAQSHEDLLWIREPFLSDPRDHGHLIVHGHTPVDHPTHYGNRIALDGGAGWGKPLHAAVFEGRDCWLLTDHGRVALHG